MIIYVLKRILLEKKNNFHPTTAALSQNGSGWERDKKMKKMLNDFHRNWTPPSQLEPHIVRISPRKRLHFNATKENIALQGPPQHLSVWKDNLKRLPARNCGLLHLITTISLCHKHENTGHGHQPVSLSGFKKVLQVVRSFLWHGWTLKRCQKLQQKKGDRSNSAILVAA